MDYINRLLNYSPASPEPSGNEASPLKGEQQQQQQQHDVKVRFIREFGEATGGERNTESASLSSASSFQSLTSTLSSKCSTSGICLDSSPGKASDRSYLSTDIPGLDDLISGCENIRLGDTTVNLSTNQSFNLQQLDGQDLSGDQTFTSATDEKLTLEISRENLGDFTRELENCLANVEERTVNETFVQCLSDIPQEITISLVNCASEQFNKDVANSERDKLEINISQHSNNILDQFEPSTVTQVLEKSLKESTEDISAQQANETIESEFFDEPKGAIKIEKSIEISRPVLIEPPELQATTLESASSLEDIQLTRTSLPSICSESKVTEPADIEGVVENDTVSIIDEPAESVSKKFAQIVAKIGENDLCTANYISAIKEPTFINQHKDDSCEINEENSIDKIESREVEIETRQQIGKNKNPEIFETNNSGDSEDLNATVTIQDISAGNLFAAPEVDQYAEFLPNQQSTGLVLGDEYAAFKPEKQSTNLATCFVDTRQFERQDTPFVTAFPPIVEDDRCNFAKLEVAANAVANDIYNKSLELEEENDRFVTATGGTELFTDPGGFDFLLSKTPRKNPNRNLRSESLYIKFDPLVSNTSMLPQGNAQTPSPPGNEEERIGENNPTIVTPKRNPALAAIDRLLFYSPMTNTPTTNSPTIDKTNDAQEKAEATEETSEETVNMAKELELVRSTVIQLEDELEKVKIDNAQKETSYLEKINQLQAQLGQEIKNKNQITVVVDEYEKSISRLVAERERDRKNLDLEKGKLQEELAAAKHHLDNTEAAFNDVHLKYERLKAVVATYKSNETALKESLQENVEIIKSLENRYEQVKSHATARLEKANQDLEAIRKQNESETVRLHAMVRKAELKSNSLAELVEQKTKENKELTQILDEVIARVGRNKSE